jgi:hypothetical protein
VLGGGVAAVFMRTKWKNDKKKNEKKRQKKMGH